MTPYFLIPLAFAANSTEQIDATRSVIRAIVTKAEQLRFNRLSGDALTNEYVRVAAQSALARSESVRVSAFLIGVGVALDDSTLLKTNPLIARALQGIETDTEQKVRLKVLGQPSIRGRRDLCLHFTSSAMLSELLGPAMAESLGMAKEMLDMSRPGGSGFSFADLTANFAGLSFAKQLQSHPDLLTQFAISFDVKSHVPSVEGLPEGITPKQFATEYGSADDPRFRAVILEARKRVAEATTNRR